MVGTAFSLDLEFASEELRDLWLATITHWHDAPASGIIGRPARAAPMPAAGDDPLDITDTLTAPPWFRLGCAACHLVLGLVYGLAGLALVAISLLDLGAFARTFAASKALAFAAGVLTAIATFCCLRRAEIRAEMESPRWSDAGSATVSWASSPGRATPVPQPAFGQPETRARELIANSWATYFRVLTVCVEYQHRE